MSFAVSPAFTPVILQRMQYVVDEIRRLHSEPRMSFSSHPTCDRHHRHPTRTRATMFPDWGSQMCDRPPRRSAKLPQAIFSAIFELSPYSGIL